MSNIVVNLRLENVEGDDSITVTARITDAEYRRLDDWLTACAQSYDGLNSVILDQG